MLGAGKAFGVVSRIKHGHQSVLRLPHVVHVGLLPREQSLRTESPIGHSSNQLPMIPHNYNQQRGVLALSPRAAMAAAEGPRKRMPLAASAVGSSGFSEAWPLFSSQQPSCF